MGYAFSFVSWGMAAASMPYFSLYVQG